MIERHTRAAVDIRLDRHGSRGRSCRQLKNNRVCDQADAEHDARDAGHVEEVDQKSFVKCHALLFAAVE